MIGKFLSKTIKVVTLPVDASSAGLDILAGGNGSKNSRNSIPNPVNLIEKMRDATAKAAEDADK